MPTPEPLFPGDEVNRYAFLWRDVTRYVSVEDKRSAAVNIEKFRKKGGKGLPVVTLNPQMFVSTQSTSSANDTKSGKALPMVVKLHGVYYLVDGFYRNLLALVPAHEYIKVHLLDLDKD